MSLRDVSRVAWHPHGSTESPGSFADHHLSVGVLP